MEKRSRLARLTGVIYIVAAIFGLVISVGGLVVLWSTCASVTHSITDSAELAGRSLAATSQTVVVINESLDRASENLVLIHAITVDMALTMDDSQDLIDATAGLIGSDLAGFFEETQQSLEAVEASADTVDQALNVIDGIRATLSDLRAVIPFVPPAPREPQLPRATLRQSVAEVRRGLDPVPGSLGEIERQLTVSAANVAAIQAEVERLAEEVAKIESNLEDARSIAAEYRELLDMLQERFERFEERLPLNLRVIYTGLTLLLVWIFMTQTAMLVNGIEMLVE